MPAISPWTEERVETLTRLLAERRTAAEIAACFGDITRNAVIGKAHRMGLSSPRPRKTVRLRPKPKLPTKPPTKLPTRSRPVTLSPKPRRLTLLELGPNQCRYPLDNDLFCGADTRKGFSYCDYHYKICHMKREGKPNGGLTFTKYF